MDSIKIGPMTYQIEVVDELRDKEGRKADGIIMYKALKILIESEATVQSARQILWHEILHGILAQGGVSLKDEEVVCEVLSHGIMSVLQDNRWINDDN
jgi:hypothetical protein